MKNKFLTLLLLPLLLVTSCNKQEEPEEKPFEVDKQFVYGMTDIGWQEYEWSHISFTEQHKLYDALGVKSVRFWTHATWVLKDPYTVNEAGYKTARDSFNEIKDKGYLIIGLSHGSFKRMYLGQDNSSKGSAKPPRDLKEGSNYLKWLQEYEDSWYTLVGLFPEIEYWEIDNETNNTDFMSRVGGGQFSKVEMAQITYDMMYFASRGIHRANPNAKTVMGGLVMKGLEDFLENLYDLILNGDQWDSTNPDDYFQVACWHPYMEGFNKKRFINLNNSIYEVVKRREGKDKKVFLTEAGFNDTNYNLNEEKIGQYVKDMYQAAKDDLYYVESLCYYRMWDLDSGRYGLFTNPTKLREGENAPNKAAPKPAAYAYQEVAGGSGDLQSFEKYILENGTCS